MSRKYKFKGYMENEDNEKRKREKGKIQRGKVITEYRKTMKCGICGEEISFVDIIDPNDKCKNCGHYLHSCKNCVFFDPGSPKECMKNVEKRIVDKNGKNECKNFKPRIIVEKKVSRQLNKSEQARKAFDDLFKI